MTKIVKLTKEEEEAILKAREQKQKELEEQLAAEKKVLLQQKSNLEDQKRRELRSFKHVYDNTFKVFNALKVELAKAGIEDAVSISEEEVTQDKYLRTWNKTTPYIKYKLTYLKAKIVITYKRFYKHNNEIDVNSTNVELKGNLIESYWLTSTHRKYSIKTFAKKLIENHSDAQAQYDHHNKRIGEVEQLLEVKKEQYSGLANVKTVDIRKCYTKSADHDKSVCVEFNSGSKIYFGYRYSFREEPEIIKVEDALESDRTELDWTLMFNKQKKK